MSNGFALIVLLVLAGIAGVCWLSYHQAKMRREQFGAFAASQGWTYADADDSLTAQWQGEPFGAGDNRRAINVVTGPFEGRPIVAFDYSYQTHTDNNGQRTTTTHRFGIVAMQMPGALPWLQVEHEGLFGGAVANAAGAAAVTTRAS